MPAEISAVTLFFCVVFLRLPEALFDFVFNSDLLPKIFISAPSMVLTSISTH